MTDIWTMQRREEEIEYCQAHRINLRLTQNTATAVTVIYGASAMKVWN